MEIYEMIEMLRVNRGITKSHIAKRFSKTITWYTFISEGKINIKAKDIPIFAELLGVSSGFFFEIKEDE